MPLRDSYADGEFCWVDLVAHDMEAAERFYGELFNWKAVRQDTGSSEMHYAEFTVDGKSVAGIGQMSAEMKAQGIPPLWNSYVNVADVNAAAEKAASLGAVITVPPMKVVEAGWLAFIQDPGGAMVGLWQKNRHFGAQLVNDPGAFCWNELATRDAEKSKEFYGSLFGWEFADNPGSPSKYYIIKNQGRDNGGIIQMTEQWGDMPPCWGVYFTVSDMNATVERLQKLGGKVCVPPFDTSVGPIAVVCDPQGGTFSLIQIKG